MDTHVTQFIVPGKACTQGSKDQFGREANRRLPGWRSDVRDAARSSIRGLAWDMGAPMSITWAAYYARPKGHTVGGHGVMLKANAPEYPGRVGDSDKVARALLDALTGVLWHDDDQVVELGPGLKLYAAPGDPPVLVCTVQACPQLPTLQQLHPYPVA